MHGLMTGLLILIAHVTWPSIVYACPDGEPIVETRTGKVRGVKLKNEEGQEFCSFQGVPYAKPPIGQLRFKDPQPTEPWQGVREATTYSPLCAQIYTINNQIYGEEDCLYLNVYTRNTKPKVLLPVIFWIYGGYFIWGRSDNLFYGPEYLMLRDVVLVTVNYREGPLGFLNLDDEMASGNQGLKDQLLALHWVRDNIANFGGDPNSVTVAGQNSGAASAHFFAISPLGKNLFHRIIVQSTVALNPWTFQENTKAVISSYLARLNFTSEDKKATLEFLQSMDVKTLLVAYKNLITKDDKIRMQFHFGPTIDSKSKNPVLPAHPEVLAANGIQYPLLLGYTNREGIILYMHISKVYDRFNGELEQLLHPKVLKMFENYGLTIEDVKRMYFTDGVLKRENIDQLVDLVGDVNFVHGIQRTLKIQAEKSSAPTYFYQFTYDREKSLMKLVFSADMSGASQWDELAFLFRYKYMEGRKKFPVKGTELYTLTERMVEMWVNFATTGVPTLSPSEVINFDWLPINKENSLQYLNICESPRMETALSLEKKYTTR